MKSKPPQEAGGDPETVEERAKHILTHTPLIDGHNDLAIFLRAYYNNHINDEKFTKPFTEGGLQGHVDIPRLRAGLNGGAFWSVFWPCPANDTDYSDANYAPIVQATLQQIDVFTRLQQSFPGTFSPVNHLTPHSALHYFHKNLLISPLGIEGLHQIGNSAATLRQLYSLGVRYATLTHNCGNRYADAALSGFPPRKADPVHHGLSPEGIRLIQEMNRLGMIVDLSHTSVDTMLDVLGANSEKWAEGSAAPVIFSHSSAYGVCPHPRNVPDHVLDAVKKNGGVVMVNFAPDFISCVEAPDRKDGLPEFYPQNSTLGQVVRHVRYVADRIGFEHVGFGSDFDGIETVPEGLEDVSKYPDLVAELLRQGVSDEDAAKVVGGNVLRVWREVEKVAAKLQKKGTPPGLFISAVPKEWQAFLLENEPMVLLDFFMRDDLSSVIPDSGPGSPPESLLQYVKDIRRHSLQRSFHPSKPKLPVLPRSVALGMKTKKIHEVTHFAGYIDRLAEDVAQSRGKEFTHFVDFGSGQNYLGRALASPPYNRHIVAVESREENMAGAKDLDILSGLAEKEKRVRNKKLYHRILEAADPSLHNDEEALKRIAKDLGVTDQELATIDLRSRRELEATYTVEDGKGSIEYVVGRLEHADLTDVLSQLRGCEDEVNQENLNMMAVSIHSCGNLSHYGIRSMILNPCIRTVAIVGCCYNLMTEKLGPPSYKPPFSRPSLQPINARVVRESEKRDPQGFPMSERVSTYNDEGIRLNITARMMACQAPGNWTEVESNGFFTRHFYRAVLQKIFLDQGVISRVYHGEDGDESPFNSSTNPVIIGSLRKQCYTSFSAYVRGAIAKLTTNKDYSQYNHVIREKLGAITDEEIARYEVEFRYRMRELSAVWTLMAFSACVVESLIVTDRWLFLREHSDVVQDCWVEAVFDYRESPRNLVVVGIKR
ncbi:membrane dipeptidase-domain-containing protein [Podospora australis]|uniref:Dipeptidase n=1 Tax=Podospora australis TaxID=1536484 RepID=A0AAN6X529_9PEZI|nr:membrane dipeptidase-domain-containing protein [Podospora australis]